MKLPRKGPSRRGSAERLDIVEGSREGRLLDACRDLMVERDSLDVTLFEVAQRAEVNHALVGYYFGNKEGLFVALLLRHSSRVPRELNALLDTSLSPLEKLQAHIRAVLRVYDECPILGTLLDYVLKTGSSEAVAKVNDMVVKPMVDFYDKLVMEGVAVGAFVKTDPFLLHLMVIGACTSVHANRARLRVGYGIVHITPTLHSKYVDYVIGFVSRGITKPSAQELESMSPVSSKKTGRSSKVLNDPSAVSQRSASVSRQVN